MNKKLRIVVKGKTAPEQGAVLRKGIEKFGFLTWKELKEFKPHAMNWKKHPPGQRNSLRAAIDAVGWAGSVLVNLTTNTILDGHMRAEEAIKAKEDRIPVAFGRWSPEEELIVLQTFDPIGASYLHDVAAFDSLTKVIQNQGKKLAETMQSSTEKSAVYRLVQGASALTRKLLQGGGEESDLPPMPFQMPKPSRTRPLTATEDIREIGADDGEAVYGEENAEADNLRRMEASDGEHDAEQEDGTDGEIDSERSEEGSSPIFTPVRYRADAIFEPATFFDGAEELLDPFGIPALHEDVDSPDRYVQAEAAPTGVVWDRSSKTMTTEAIYCYSSGPNFPPEREGGFLAFHTEDQRFVGAWTNVVQFVQKLERQEWRGVFEPEFSVTSELPAWNSIFNLGRSRYLARYWQEAFLPIIPLLRSYGAFETFGLDSLHACRLIPQGVPVVGCQARNMAKEDRVSKMRVLRSMFEYAVDEIGVKVIVVYGGKDCYKYLKGNLYEPSKVEYVLTPSFTASRREK